MTGEDLLKDSVLGKICRMLMAAEKLEARARRIDDKNEGFVTPCDSDFETKRCKDCLNFKVCRRHDTKDLYQKAWRGYRNGEALIRRQVEETDSEGSNAVLAQALMDIHVHPNSGLIQDTITLWEAQYLWLKLYFRTWDKFYLDSARLCEDIRNIYAVPSQVQPEAAETK